MVKKKFSLIAKAAKVHRVGGSLMVTLPDGFVKAHGILEGDQIGLLANHIIKIIPMKEEEFGDEEELMGEIISVIKEPN